MNILITGTSSGFGKEMTIALATLGHSVYAGMRGIQDKNQSSADELKALSATLHGQIIPLEIDVTNDESVEEAVSTVLANQAGILDVVINNAGSFVGGLNEAFTVSQGQDMFNVNTFGPLRVMRAVLPTLREQGKGTIINVTSSANKFPMPGSGNYVASKAALESLTESYAYELAPLGIEVLIFQPGAFNTGIMAKGTGPEDVERVNGYGKTLACMEPMMPAFMALIEDTWVNNSPTMISDAIVELLEIPYGKRPLRTMVDPSGLGNQTDSVNKYFEQAQKQFLQSIKIDQMAKVPTNLDK
ncbi:SDR family oxidoreductase [Vibrio algarum]|uniref:SDR family oxidoreductase n=1 Tax=Vibrio algarum TaxID=3020714 RepID=A0ABT4YPC7_9VIBR|nr:SDR family oxidoreductase [Vibrio sp. KJ40-1]MDB1123412.1 SDR family oxidoreductase [Vibrio sp. KJ40-1]